jgi:hypothetical protein
VSNPRLREGPVSALTLFVPGVRLADHHDDTVATDHFAVLTDRLDARLDLHCSSSLAVVVNIADSLEHGDEPLLSSRLLVAVDDPAAGQVVGAQLHDHAVLGEDADVVLAHLARDVGENLVSVSQLNAEHRIGKSFDHRALDLDNAVLFGHTFFNRSQVILLVVRGWDLALRHAKSGPKAPKIKPTPLGTIWPSQV